MSEYSAVKSLRVRYTVALLVIAVLVTGSHGLIGVITHNQETNSRVIGIAASQAGLTSRVAHFVSLMLTASDTDEYTEARAQLGRTLNMMTRNHDALLYGDVARNVPLLWNENLRIIYYDPAVGLDTAVKRYIERSWGIYDLPYGELHENSGNFVFITAYGPFVLEPMFDAAVTEYERINVDTLNNIQKIEAGVWLATIVALLLEAFFIFRPMEKRVREKIDIITRNAATLRDSLEQARESQAIARIERDRAVSADRAKAHFMSNMSHELRTPLNAILGFSEAMKYGVYGKMATDIQSQRIEDIHHSANHLLALVDDLLDLGAADAGKLNLDYRQENIADIMTGALRLIEDAATHRHIRLAVEPYNASTELYCDARRATQVLLNVLSNAVKYSGIGSSVSIAVGTVMPDNVIVIRIADTGPGMTHNEVVTALSRYGRINTNAEVSQKGTGLGLPLSLELMRLHGGDLKIDSTPGEGTVVSLFFPVYQQTTETDEAIYGSKQLGR